MNLRSSSVAAPVVAVLVIHAVLIGAYLARGNDAQDFAKVAPRFVARSHASEAISSRRFDFRQTAGDYGYDGQFALFLALDPAKARYYMDDPPYRYARILYPALVRVLSAGRAALIPVMMLVVNLLAIAVGTGAVALIMRRARLSTLWALAFGLSPGLVLGVHRDLGDVSAYALLAAGVAVMTLAGRYRLVAAAALFGLAGLARQTTLVVALAYALGMLVERDTARDGGRRVRVARAVAFAAACVAPYAAWALFVDRWLGAAPTGQAWSPIPFFWLFHLPWAMSRQPPELVGVVLPTLLIVAVTVSAARSGSLHPLWISAGVAAVGFVVFAPPYAAYPGSGRAVLAVAIPALLALPLVRNLGPLARRSYWLALASWLAVLPGVAAVDLLDVQSPPDRAARYDRPVESPARLVPPDTVVSRGHATA